MKERFWLLALVVGVAASTACGGDTAKVAPGATAASTATPSPLVGPILVYTKGRFVVAYDAGAGRKVHESAISPTLVPILDRATGEFLYRGQQGIHAVNVVTGVERVVYRPQRAVGDSIALSPDGATVAVVEVESEADYLSHAYLIVVDVASGAARTVATFADPLGDAFSGRPTPRVWRADGKGFLVSGVKPSGAPASWATVMLDGAVTMHGHWFARPSPNGRILVLDDVNGVGCVLSSPQRLRLFDVDANAEVARAEDPGRGMVIKEWSPAGDALLYEQFDPLPGTAGDGCLPTPDAATRRSFLLTAGGGAPQPVADVEALRALWHPEARVELACVIGTVDVFGSCPPVDNRNLSVNGTLIDTAENIQIAGFLPVSH